MAAEARKQALTFNDIERAAVAEVHRKIAGEEMHSDLIRAVIYFSLLVLLVFAAMGLVAKKRPLGWLAVGVRALMKPQSGASSSWPCLPGCRGTQVMFFTASGGFIGYWIRAVLSVAILRISSDLHLDSKMQAMSLSAFFYGYVFANIGYTAAVQRVRASTLLLIAVGGSSLVTLALPALTHLGGARALIGARAVTGAAQGFLFPSTYAIFSAEFVGDQAAQNRATALLGGTPALGIAANLLVSPLVMDTLGWQSTIRLAGLLGIPWSLLWLLSPMVQDPDNCGGAQSAQARGSAALGAQELEACARPKVTLSPSGRALGLPSPSGSALIWDILQAPAFYGVACGHFAHTWMNYVTMAWLPMYLHDEMGIDGSSLALSCLPYIATAVASPTLGTFVPMFLKWLGYEDLWESRRAMGLASQLLPGLAILIFPWIPRQYWPWPLLGITAALAFSTFTAVSVMATPLDIAGPKASGVMLSMSNAFASVPGFVGVQVVGELKDCCGWHVAFSSCTVLYLFGAIMYCSLGTADKLFD